MGTHFVQGYIVGPSNRVSTEAAEEQGWIMSRTNKWQTPKSEFISLAPVNSPFSALSKRHVFYFVPGWEKRLDALEIALTASELGCPTFSISGEPLKIDGAFVRRLSEAISGATAS